MTCAPMPQASRLAWTRMQACYSSITDSAHHVDPCSCACLHRSSTNALCGEPYNGAASIIVAL